MAKNNPMGKADKILSSIDQDSLKKGIEKLKSMSDAESAKLKKQLDNIDKDKDARDARQPQTAAGQAKNAES